MKSTTISRNSSERVFQHKQAVDIWKEKMVPLRKEKGKKFVIPGCASDAGGEAWLNEFMKKAEAMGEPLYFLGVHYYGPDGTVAMKYIEKMSIHSCSDFGQALTE
jgi:hypothetical protein